MNKEPNGRAPVERTVRHLIQDNKMKQWFKDFVHNCIVHPMMPFLPTKFATHWHDKNANWAFGLNRFDELKLEKPNT